MGLGRFNRDTLKTVVVIITAILFIFSGIFISWITSFENESSSDINLYDGSVKPPDQIFERFNRAPVLYVVNISNLKYDEILVLTSLQGLVNRESAELYLEYGNVKWLKFLNQTYDQEFKYISFDEALGKYKTKAFGMVIYDPAAANTVNVATTLSGYNDLIIVSPGIMTQVHELTGLNVSLDLRTNPWSGFGNSSKIYIEILEQIYPELKQDVFGMLEPMKTYLRDYLIAIRAMCVNINPGPVILPEEDEVLNKILETTPVQSTVLGWFESPTGMEENLGTQRLSKSGKVILPADHIPNLSVFAAYDFKTPPKESTEKTSEIPTLEDKIYMTFVISDGDNLGFMHNQYADLWTNNKGKDFPLGWSISPLVAEIAPPIFEFYSSSATTNDTLVCAPSGAGLFYPDFYPQNELGMLLARTNLLMENTGLDTIWLLNSYTPYEVKYTEKVINSYVDYIKPTGIFLDYGDVPITSQYRIGEGTVHSGTPIIRATHLWEDIDNFIAKVEVVKDTRPHGPFFIFAAVHVWTMGPEDVEEVIQRLQRSGEVVDEYSIVSPDIFCRLIQVAQVKNAEKNVKKLDDWPYYIFQGFGTGDKNYLESKVSTAKKQLNNGDYDSAASNAAKANNLIDDIKVISLTSTIIFWMIIIIVIFYLILYSLSRHKPPDGIRKKFTRNDLVLNYNKNLKFEQFPFILEIIALIFITTILFCAVYRVLYSNFWDWPAIGISITVAILFVPVTNCNFYSKYDYKKHFIFGLFLSSIGSITTIFTPYLLPVALFGYMMILTSSPITRKTGTMNLIIPMIFGLILANAYWSIIAPVTIFFIGALIFGLVLSFNINNNDNGHIKPNVGSLGMINIQKNESVEWKNNEKKFQKLDKDAPVPPTIFLVFTLMITYITQSRYLSIKFDGLQGFLTNISFIIPIGALFVALPLAYHIRYRFLDNKSIKFQPGTLERGVLISILAVVFTSIYFIWEPIIITFLIFIGECCLMILVLLSMPMNWQKTFPSYFARDFVILFLMMNLFMISPVIIYTLYIVHLGESLNYVLYAFPLSFGIGFTLMILPVAFYWRKQ